MFNRILDNFLSFKIIFIISIILIIIYIFFRKRKNSRVNQLMQDKDGSLENPTAAMRLENEDKTLTQASDQNVREVNKMSDLWAAKVNVRTVTTNPIIRLINFLVGVIEFFTGIRRFGFLKEKEEVLELKFTKRVLWFFTSIETTLTISKSRVTAVETSYERNYIFFKTVVLRVHAAGLGNETQYAIQDKSYEEVLRKSLEWI